MTKIRYADRSREIVAVLRYCAMEKRTITYSQLAKILGIPSQGPWKPVLDEISGEETAAGRPDITYLVVSKGNGLPGQIGFEPAKPPTDEQRRKAKEIIEEVFEGYAAL